MSMIQEGDVHPFVIAYHLRKLLHLQLRFLDTIASAYHRFEYNELPVINALLNDEIGTWVGNVVEQVSDQSLDLRYSPPYEVIEVDDVRNTWFQTRKAHLQTFLFQLETAVPPPLEQVGKPPDRFLMYQRNIEDKLKEYELAQARWDSDQFSRYYWEQKRQEEQLQKSRLEAFPENEFEFVEDLKARMIISAYYHELRHTYFAQFPKSSVILSGALIEALLVEALKLDEENAQKCYKKATEDKAQRAIADWKLAVLLDVAQLVGVLPKDLKDMMKAVKDFRNFVHIQRAIKSAIPLDDNYKEICKNALLIVIDNVRRWIGAKHR